MADTPEYNVRVGRMGSNPRTVTVPAGQVWSVSKILTEAGMAVDRDQSVSLNGTVLKDLDTQVPPGERTPVVLVNPRVSNG